MRWTLVLAGFYNIAMGSFLVAWPQLPFTSLGLESLRYPEVVQVLGLLLGSLGIGFLVAATDPLRHWPIVFVGLLWKVLFPIGMVQVIAAGRLPWHAGAICLVNDLLWWGPFLFILWRVVRRPRLYVAEP